ncbi:major facilitator superfamily domain-containing protein [Cercophora scortea]|uniref:Major facilitator superfamily domain-containing protein n=1 Tax=Cercophora scortea TaxID=314031 RepID=A0AAE0ML57_9PEZI|nr:major facilitator superfamily domain-containing protein [Cercophora scortea]
MSTLDITSVGSEPADHRQKKDEESVALTMDWSKEEEARAKRKLDCIMLPLLLAGFFCLQLDRGNIANAITDSFMEDLRIDQNQFNIGQQLLSLGIVVTEIPSNMLLYRVGPGKWLTLQLFLFGITSTFQAFQTSYKSFLLTRLILGITESGYIPGSLWTLSTWYTRDETAKRVMLFYFGSQFGSASSKLLAYGILHMRGVGGKPGWFWLFALMGAFTVLCGCILGLFLPDSTKKPHSTFLPRRAIFSARDLHILRTRVLLDDPMKGEKKPHIGLAAFKKAFSSCRLWVHIVITLANNGPQRAFDTYSPSIITSFAFPKLTSNAMASVGLFLQIPISYLFSYASDQHDWRGQVVIGGLACHLTGHAFNLAFAGFGPALRGLRYFGVVWTQTFGTFSHPLNVAWMSLACEDQEVRALSMSMVIMGANSAGIYGAQIFRADDKPLYTRGFTINIAILSLGLVLAVAKAGDDYRRKKKAAQASTGIAVVEAAPVLKSGHDDGDESRDGGEKGQSMARVRTCEVDASG